MDEVLDLLIQRYRTDIKNSRATSVGDATVSDLKRSLITLQLARAAQNKAALCERFPDHPRQVVVIGPTQVGKSTMVNLLLNQQPEQELATSSAKAGFTVHCQGYAIGLEGKDKVRDPDQDKDWLKTYFSGMDLREQSMLDRKLLNEYSYSTLSQPYADLTLPYSSGVFWDTPDFDSIESFGYREPVLQAIALADLIVFVVSKEKYADKTVWDMQALLLQLSKPVLFVMNKTPPAVRSELTESVRQKYKRLDAGESHLPEVFFIDEYRQGPSGALGSADVLEIQSSIASTIRRDNPEVLRLAISNYMSTYWRLWTTPVAEDHRIQAEWKLLVDNTAADLVNRYKTEYLQHDRYRETFRLALAELLTLLEVPGMAEPLTRIRSVVTWPMRKLIATATEAKKTPQEVKDDRSDERRLLEELGEHGLSKIAVSLADKQADSIHWANTLEKLSAEKSNLLKSYHNGLDNYQILLQVEIERAAQSLYKSLQEQPATLNSLRAARVTADAAAVVLAVKSGGLGAADLVIAPAMLSLTSMLTEGALGQYMQKVQDELKTHQEKEVAAVISRKLRARVYPLLAMAEGGKSLSQDQLQQAADNLGIKATESVKRDNHV